MAKIEMWSPTGKKMGTVERVASWKVTSDDDLYVIDGNREITQTDRALRCNVAALQRESLHLRARIEAIEARFGPIDA